MREVLLIYFSQYGSKQSMSASYPNVYYLAMQTYDILARGYETLKHPALFVTLAVLALFVCAIWRFKETISKANMVYIGIWCIWTCLMFLPGMHERFSFPIEVLLTMFVLTRDVKKIWVVVGINMIAAITYSKYLFQANNIMYYILAPFNVIIYFYVTYDLYRSLQAEARKSPTF
ncbi:MAG: hypothetical protein LBI54_00550 [Lachnospiraceae bacterium]|nr:hypothetical protein [Lachnospiraceae bacterium]